MHPSTPPEHSESDQFATQVPGNAGDTVDFSSSTVKLGWLNVRCPSCHQPIGVPGDTSFTDVTCSSCGSHFSLVDQSQDTRMAAPLSTMGRFELIERLGVGGFGTVWKARDKELDRTVAVKIPRQGGMSSDEQEKFFREARAAAQLKHPNIVSVHEVGREGDSIFIVCDFIRGVTLGDWLTGQQLTSREAADLGIKIAEALDHAHEKGVVHRDLKPANIMVDGDGQPHLMDFGLARREVGEVTMTADGQVLGTPAYMSPEQAQGEAHTADRRSDVYSLGVILFQMLTGERPFRGNARMLIHQVIHDEPPTPRKFNSNIPRDLETIVLKCLEKDPDRRYQAAKDLSNELRRFLAGEPIHARPIGRVARGWRWAKRNSGIAFALVLFSSLLVSLAFSFFLWKTWRLSDQSRKIAESNAMEAKKQEALAKENEHRARQNAAEAEQQEDLAKNNELLARRNAEEALRQRQIADENREELLVANAIITRQQGKLLAGEAFASYLLGDYPQCLHGYLDAYDALKNISASTRPVDLAMVSLFRRAPTPLAVHRPAFYAYAICLGPGENTAIVYSKNGAGILDMRTGELVKSLRQRPINVSRCLYLPKRNLLVVADNLGNIEVSDAETEATINQWNVLNDGADVEGLRPEHLEFRASSNEEMIAWQYGTWGIDVYSTLWSLDGTKLWSDTGQSSGVSFDSNSQKCLMGEKLLDLTTLTVLREYDLPANIISAAVSADGGQAVLGSWHGTLWAYDLSTGQLVRDWHAHKGLVHTLELTPNREYLFSGSQDGTVCAWRWSEIFEGVEPLSKKVFQGDSNSSIWRVATLSDNRRLLSAEAGNIYVWDLNASDGINRFLDTTRIRTAKFSKNGEWLLVLAEDSDSLNVILFDASIGRIVFQHRLVEEEPNEQRASLDSCAAVLSEDAEHVWLAAQGLVRCIEIATGRIIKGWSFPKLGSECHFSLDGKTFGSRTDDFLHCWNTETGQYLTSFPTSKSWRRISLSPTGQRVAVLANSSLVNIKPLALKEAGFSIQGPQAGAADDMSWGSDDLLYLCGSLNRRLMGLDVNQQKVEWLSSHQRGIRFVSVEPAGNWALTSSYDGSTRFWELDSGTSVLTLLQDDFPNVQLASDARAAAFWSLERGLEIWNLDWPRRYYDMQALARDSSSREPMADPETLRNLSEWYAYRGAWDWARELRVRFDQVTGRSSTDFLVRCSLAIGSNQGIEQALVAAESNDSISGSSKRYWLRRVRQNSDKLIVSDENADILHDPEADAAGIQAALAARDSLSKNLSSKNSSVSWQDAHDYFGQTVVVTGKIANVGAIANYWFLNFGERGQFVAVVPKASFGKFPDGAPHIYEGKAVEVLGEISLHKGAPQIIVNSPDQIRITGDNP